MPSESLDKIKSFMMWWNAVYPIDRWWREKYKVAFNSPQHKAMCFIDMKMEYEEDMLFKGLNSEEGGYKPGTGDWLKKRRPAKMSQRETDELFDRFDPNSVKLTEDGKIVL